MFYYQKLSHSLYSFNHAKCIQKSMSRLHAKAKTKSKHTTEIITIEDIYSDGYKLQNVVDILKNGGMGVICTDTCYSFVASVESLEGINRITKLKSNLLHDDSAYQQKKPLTLLCHDIKMASQYTSYLNENWVFKLLKATLPGPYTYIMPSTNNLPKTIIEHNKHVKRLAYIVIYCII